MAEQPKIGDKVWVNGRKPQPNGEILLIDRSEDSVIVLFHANSKHGGRADSEDYLLETFTEEFSWTDSFGGTWMKYEEG